LVDFLILMTYKKIRTQKWSW